MRIEKFSIRRYRAFDKDITITLSNFTVFVGPNNLGKSTILRAINMFFALLLRKRMSSPARDLPYRYSLEHDYPKKYIGKSGRRWPTKIAANIIFSEEERINYKTIYNKEIPETVNLSSEYSIDSNGFVNIWTSSSEIRNEDSLIEFLRWFSSNFRFVYIPATRNIDDFRRSVFSEIVEGAINNMKQSKRRIEALERFYSDVRDSVKETADSLTKHLRAYLPKIETLDFKIEELDLPRFISVRDVEINDGAKTPLSQKGDGFKSLFALSILQFLSQRRYGANLIFGIEEPESHLHSTAIYLVKAALRELSKDFQVLITTHSSILIQRDSIKNNIVVDQTHGQEFASSAKQARNLSQIRNSLGIRPQDNLTTAAVVVVVEGATEENCIAPLLSYVKRELSQSISSGQIRILSAGGVTKILPCLRALARDVASCIVLVDSDDEGIVEKNKIINSGLISISDVFQVPIRHGCQETEFEDVFDPNIYIEEVARACGISITVQDFLNSQIKSGNQHTRMAKWSKVLASIVAQHGRDWGLVADDAKIAFGKAITQKITQIPPRSIVFIKSISERILRYLKEE